MPPNRSRPLHKVKTSPATDRQTRNKSIQHDPPKETVNHILRETRTTSSRLDEIRTTLKQFVTVHFDTIIEIIDQPHMTPESRGLLLREVCCELGRDITGYILYEAEQREEIRHLIHGAANVSKTAVKAPNQTTSSKSR
jgi:hypothetical protein